MTDMQLERSDVIRRPISESAPTSCIGTCEATGAEVLRHLLVESAVSGRLALPEFTTTCALSGKRVLSEEVEPSSVTGKLAASAPNRSTLAAASSSRRIPGNAGVAQERPGLNVSGGANSRSLSPQLRYMRSSVPRLTTRPFAKKIPFDCQLAELLIELRKLRLIHRAWTGRPALAGGEQGHAEFFQPVRNLLHRGTPAVRS
jgi:hypothetical protein